MASRPMFYGEKFWNNPDNQERNRIGMSERGYLALTCGFTLAALYLTTLVGYLSYMTDAVGILPALLIGLILPFLGIIIAAVGDNTFTSTLGLALVATGFGIMFGPLMHLYNLRVILLATGATAAVATVASVVGILIPRSIDHWGGWLFTGLLALLGVNLAEIVMQSYGFATPHGWRSTTVPWCSSASSSCTTGTEPGACAGRSTTPQIAPWPSTWTSSTSSRGCWSCSAARSATDQHAACLAAPPLSTSGHQ